MTKEQLREILLANTEELRSFGVRAVSVFGSVARGTASRGSDVDLLVDFEGPATFSGYMGLKLRLEELLGVEVDIVSRRALRPELETEILSEAVRVA